MTDHLLHHRLNMRWELSDRLSARMEWRNRWYLGDVVRNTPYFSAFIEQDNGWMDLSWNLVEGKSTVLNARIDRLLLNWSGAKWTVTVGRQRINWGINLVWNPNDLFNAYNYFDFDYEERPGTDGLRVQYVTGSVSSLEGAIALADQPGHQAGALMYKTHVGRYDLQFIAGSFRQDLVAGGGWAGSLGNTGWKGELMFFHPGDDAADSVDLFLASVSLDRTFKGDYFATLSYLYNSQGREDDFAIGLLSGVDLSVKNLMPFRHTFFGQLSKGFNPITAGSLAIMYSPARQTLILLPVFTWSLHEDWDLSFIGQSFFSRNQDVYGSLGQVFYLRLRWSY